MKNNKGITLIVLVVTIVVLIILTAITLNSTLGNRGIINSAKDAVNALENEQQESGDQMNAFYNNLVQRETYN